MKIKSETLIVINTPTLVIKKRLLLLPFICILCAFTPPNPNTDLKPQNACESVSKTLVAKTLGWPASAINAQSMGHSEGKRSLCYFSHQNEKLWIRLGWKSEKAQSLKTLENQFNGYLKNGENEIKYEALNKETLLGEKPADATNPKLYIYRKRYGNAAEVTLELYSNSKNRTNALNAFKNFIAVL